MVTTTALLFSHRGQMRWVVFLLDVGIIVEAGLCTLLSFPEVYTFLF